MQIHETEVHTITDCSCKNCHFDASLDAVLNHLSQSKDCKVKPKHRRITIPKT